ncbi:MAG TPA: AtzE family amidohydrolase, partial [Steroidobacteraceae bacterium]|nr:AtzE family amidohydrolase [Steroidobacteraceae bacterium]
MNPSADFAHRIAARVRAREVTAEEVVSDALSRIDGRGRELNCFTAVLTAHAHEDAARLDRLLAGGMDPGPLAGVPFGVKDLFDVAGVVTLAGSKILAAGMRARQDAPLVRRLRQAGAVLVGCQNMDEFAYGFTTENAHYGTTRNPHDPARIAGGSSGGSAAAVAAGLTPLALASDTNGSIRVPASLCGVFGLKPTFGRLPRTGTFPFVHELDHVGPLARCTADLALCYDLLQGHDAGDPACAMRPFEPATATLQEGIGGLRAGVLDGWFVEGASAAALEAVTHVADVFHGATRVTLPEARRARAAAFCITCSSGAELHRERLRERAPDFDPAVRDRLFAGTLLPATVVARAQRLRRWFAQAASRLFERVDVLLAPATPVVAPRIGEQTMLLDDVAVPVRPNL